MRTESLHPLTGGINRLRVKGGADARQLYDLVNGYVDAEGCPRNRPGTRYVANVGSGTKGLTVHNGEFVVFSNTVVTVPSGFKCAVLNHPTTPLTGIAKIHFAKPFLGYLYVCAEFVDGVVSHYWLFGEPWTANTTYAVGDAVKALTDNGLVYRGHSVPSTYADWQPDVARTVGDYVQPTTPNGFAYIVDSTTGAQPKSGSTEPTWPTTNGATVVENTTDGTTPPPPDPPPAEPPPPAGGTLPPDTEDNYCVLWDMVLDDGTQAIDAIVGDLHATYTPEEGWQRRPVEAVGAPEWQPCVELVRDDGARWRGSRSTPFTLPGAPHDLADGWTALAPDMLGREVYGSNANAHVIVEVRDIGEQWVVPLSFGGRSFGAGVKGDDPTWSHNLRKVGL